MMGVIITSLVMAALSGVCVAVAAGWKQGEIGRSTWVSGTGVVTQLQRTLRDAQYLGYVIPGSATASPAVDASVFYWRGDDFNTTYTATPPAAATDTNDYADGAPQIGEMGLLEFNAAAGTLTRYEVNNWRKLSAAQHAAACEPLTYAEFVTTPSVAVDFKAYLSASGGAGVTTVLARGISAAAFSTVRADEATPTGRPVVRFTLKFRRTADATLPTATALSGETVQDGSITLRAPTTRPVNF